MSQTAHAVARRLTTIQQRYTRLWTAFLDAAEAQALSAVSIDSRGADVHQENGVSIATAEIFLKGWPFKAVSKRKAVDIAIRVREAFSSDLSKVEKATTQIAYFLRDTATDNCRPLLELHYDFETPVREAHPTFHAQLGATNWETERLKHMGLPGSIENRTGTCDYANARIPTTCMGFGPILVMLAADHLKPRHFRLMMKAARGDDEGKLDPECSFLSRQILPVGVPHTEHWYDDRYVVHEWEDKKAKVRVASIPILAETYTHKNTGALRQQVAAKLDVEVKHLFIVEGEPGKSA